jgi:hypothetical protein
MIPILHLKYSLIVNLLLSPVCGDALNNFLVVKYKVRGYLKATPRENHYGYVYLPFQRRIHFYSPFVFVITSFMLTDQNFIAHYLFKPIILDLVLCVSILLLCTYC